MRYRPGSEHGPERETQGRDVELLRVRRSQRVPRDEGRLVKARRRGGRGRRRVRREAPAVAPRRTSLWGWFRSLFAPRRERSRAATAGAQETRVLTEFCRQYGLPFRDLGLLKLALTHRSYLSVTGQGPRESNERLEFLGDSVLGLVTSEALYRRHPDEHEGQLTKTKSLLVSKAILSRRALRIGLGRFVLMSHSEVESGGRQRLSILADAFEAVIGAIYLDQGFESARTFIHKHLLEEADAITSDKRHTNYKSHLQEYVQNAFRTHPVYRIRSEFGPDHSKHFVVEVVVGKRTLGEGRGHNKKEAEQAAARDALEQVERVRRKVREDDDRAEERSRDAGDVRSRDAREVRTRDGGDVRSRDRGEERPRDREGRRAPSARRPEPAVAAPAPPMSEPEDEAESDVRRRRGRRGGGRRHGRMEEGRAEARAVAPAEPPAESREAEREPPAAVTAREPVARAPLEDQVIEPRVEPARPPVRPAMGEKVAATPSPREPRFGRGRRREPAPGTPASPPPAAAEPAGERLVDPFESEPVAPPTGGRSFPVVDLAADEPVEAPEPERDRDQRIDEMERALENFGRRRSPDYGRRGRRR